ncbi:hypothetical protein IAG41_18340 [Sphingomonas sp. JC676]|uniref:hypothetical protein n=1 Tax=Sphingomonas sp. JC676 TaxID=2768065 RepID=UPI001657E426|nr:hypothetical protein [Sphingomonas sp. JC676]MBC9034352.1 hypothetical protein [Sphingomonas sp. JC676]
MSYLGAGQGFIGAVELPHVDGLILAGLLNGTGIGQDNFHEMAAMVRFAERRGADLIQFHLGDDDLSDLRHPLHLAFLETLRDPILTNPIVDLGDIAPWRERALESELPSDALGTDYDRAELDHAIRASLPQVEARLALCAAGHVRFPEDLELFGREAQALYELGFRTEARARLAACVALGGEAIAIG